jgi:glycosyltransferase involved in cell wall biosynthesis
VKNRILVMAHGHPDFSLGGAEMAAYQLYKAAKTHADVESATFLAAHGRSGTGAIRMRRPDEYLWEQNTHGSFQFQATNRYATLTTFRSLIEHLRPTVVYMHHYIFLGLECIRVIRDVDPNIKIVITLHEMLAICNNNGQMVKTENLRLCDRETPEDCHRCFPHATPESFWLRKQYIMSYFDLVDHFVTPSAFLKERYVDWGLSGDRITVIENGQQDATPLPPRPLLKGQQRSRFAFFGQINPYKGVDVLLEALALIPEKDRKMVSIEIHGANLEHQSPEFQKRIGELREPLEKAGVLRWVGPYTREDLSKRMERIDWLLVPSVWWENSPMVIQESFALGRPVICSDIGGMAEKVRHGVDGWHVQTKNRNDWADTLVRLSQDTELWNRLQRGIDRPISYQECVTAHLSLC